jgi:heat shock protein HslJ
MQFGEVVQNFEGEADPSRMTLGIKTWNWVSATRGGKEIVPKQPDKFTLTFSDDETFSATTDCNSMGGSYTAKDGMISFGDIFSTKMFCQDSQETEVSALLTAAQSYRFTSKGELILTLKDGGTAVFR